MNAWMTGPTRTPNGNWKFQFWTDAPWPFYHGSVTLDKIHKGRTLRWLAETHFTDWTKKLSAYVKSGPHARHEC